MAFKLPSLIEETFTTTGTGPITLGGAVTRRKTFASALSNADTCFYAAEGGTDYEEGLGTYSGGVLTRTQVFKSSNANAAVDWPAGTKTIRIAPLGPSDLDATNLGRYTDLLLGTGSTLAPLARLAGVILSGCTLSNNATDATNDIDIAAGHVVSDDGAAVMTVPALTKRLDAAWAVGSGQGGLDTGSIANGTYHKWAIQRSDTGVVDVLFSASASAPTMPTDYDRKAYLGAVLRESAALVPFTQNGVEFLRKTPIADVNTTNPGTSAVLVTHSVPTGIVVDVIASYTVIDPTTAAGTATALLVTSPDQTDTAASTFGPMDVYVAVGTVGDVQAGSITKQVRTNTSRQTRYRQTNAATDVIVRVTTFGWRDRQMKRLAA